jgi:hypothetical protein
MMRKSILLAVFALMIPKSVPAQSNYVVLEEAEEIALARSAAPWAVSAEADIWVLREGQFELTEKGSNGNACIVLRGWDPRSLAPTCYDPEGARTVLPRKLLEWELRHEGKSRAEVTVAVAQETISGGLPLPSRPTMAYMFSSGQRLYPGGEDLGNWKPHVMLYMPFITARELGLTEDTDSVMLAWEGTAKAILHVVVPEFVDPKLAAGP